jgi:phosphate transport system protein
MHRHFDDELDALRGRIVTMGGLAESMIHKAVRSLVERREDYWEQVFLAEEEVNELQIEIDDRAIHLAALQQPLASDIRFVFMSSRIASDLERIADQAVNICQNAKFLLQAPPLKPLIDLPIMAAIAEKMVHDGLDSLVRRDVALAATVLAEERKVDAFKDQIFRELLTYMMGDTATIPRALAIIFISRNLERVGDHATNIAEEAIYLVQGRDVRHHHETKVRNRPPSGGARGPESSPDGAVPVS